jgi:hypothetical protein
MREQETSQHLQAGTAGPIVGAGTIFALLDPRRYLSPDSLLRFSWIKVRVLIRPPE